MAVVLLFTEEEYDDMCGGSPLILKCCDYVHILLLDFFKMSGRLHRRGDILTLVLPSIAHV